MKPTECAGVLTLLEHLRDRLRQQAKARAAFADTLDGLKRWCDARELRGESNGLRHAADEVDGLIEAMRLVQRPEAPECPS